MTEPVERWPEPPGTEQRIAQAVARVMDGEDAGKLYEQALARLAYRRRHSGKTCERCRETKALSEFSKDSRNPDGLRRYCRACDSAAYRSRRVNDHSA